MKRILILGGGFGGIYAAMELEKKLHGEEAIITLVSKDNYLLFTPMLHEVASGDVSVTDIVCPIRQLLKRTIFLQGDVTKLDLDNKRITVTHCSGTEHDDIAYDYLLIALGSNSNFFGLPGVMERAVTMKSLADAIQLRNLLLASLEEAEFDASSGRRRPLLTYVVAGAGFAGVETVAGINDFLREAIRLYPHLHEDMLRVVLVDMIPTPLPEIGEELGKYAATKLQQRKVELQLSKKIVGMSEQGLELGDGSLIKAVITVWTAGVTPNPILRTLPCELHRNKIVVNQKLEVPSYSGVWAIGDCALINDHNTGKPYPPTAQHATRQGTVAALNIISALRGKAQAVDFTYKSMGAMAAIGHRAGVAKIMGLQFSGFIAWVIWRSVYLMKLPGLDRRTRVAVAWTVDFLFKRDFVQFMEISKPLVQNDESGASTEQARVLDSP